MRVILIGWGNATPGQLRAYEQIYATLRLDARSVIPETRTGLLDPTEYHRALSATARTIDDSREPAIVHLFSDNGFIGWAALLDQVDARDRIVGVISDSSPGLWNVRGRLDFARRFSRGMTPAVARALRLDARQKLPVVSPALVVAFLAYQALFPKGVRNLLGAASRVAARQPHCPHLYVYGGADSLVPPSDVRAWIELQRARGIPVESELFANAKHVALYPSDPRRYREAIARFVKANAPQV